MNLASAQSCLLALLAMVTCASWCVGDDDTPQFDKHILPIFTAKCGRCHSVNERKGEFEVFDLASVVAGGESGAVVIAGDPQASRLVELIESKEMPPEGEDPLSLTEIEIIRRWVSDGHEIRRVRNQQQVTTERIEPLMLLRCVPCHGHRRKEANLDLRTKATMLTGGKSGPAIIAGEPGSSLMLKRVHAGEMPPRRQLVSVSVKPMESHEIALLERWIAAGLPDGNNTRNHASTATAEPPFWSFESPQVQLPNHNSFEHRSANAIDVFVEAKLREHGLTPVARADRQTLIRRVYFDLLGLPPQPDEIDEFVFDSHPLAYQRLVERLLASPRYGVRWGRHWLDVAGYADSEGAQNEDRVRPNMWRYRDYVIRAFNDDKPYDRFLHEQIAGDELADYQNAETITDDLYDNLVATGFLRTTPDRTFANITNFVPDRLEVIADEIQVLSSAVMGLTIHCARCHAHKFDPISQRDYYQLAALLKDAWDEHDWLGPQARTLSHVTTTERRDWEQHEATIAEQVKELKAKLAAADSDAKGQLEEAIRSTEAMRRPEPRIRALWSRGTPSPTYLLRRGNYLTPGEQVDPTVPDFLANATDEFAIAPPPNATATGRRLALAKWLTQPNHPLTARVMVNRLWQHHFGRGIVATPGNFGKMGAEPTHPALLDWLAVEFVQRGWSVKAMHRLIVTSDTYQRSSSVPSALLSADPENRWLARMPQRRMEAEVLRDSLLSVAGQLDETMYGPPDGVDVQADGLVTSKRGSDGWRRSAFVLHRRTKLPTLLENFDSPQMGPNCLDRDESIVAPQALHLMNDATVHAWAKSFAERVWHEADATMPSRIRRIHQLALGTDPSAEQLAVAEDSIAKLEQVWRKRSAVDASANEPAIRALTNYCHAIMNSAAFVYID